MRCDAARLVGWYYCTITLLWGIHYTCICTHMKYTHNECSMYICPDKCLGLGSIHAEPKPKVTEKKPFYSSLSASCKYFFIDMGSLFFGDFFHNMQSTIFIIYLLRLCEQYIERFHFSCLLFFCFYDIKTSVFRL